MCLYRLWSLSDSILFQLYCSFILPIFDYDDTVWAPPPALHSKSMEFVHARFGSHICNDIEGYFGTMLSLSYNCLSTSIKFYITFYMLTFTIYLCFLMNM